MRAEREIEASISLCAHQQIHIHSYEISLTRPCTFAYGSSCTRTFMRTHMHAHAHSCPHSQAEYRRRLEAAKKQGKSKKDCVVQ